MKEPWTPEKVRVKVELLTQSNSPYVSKYGNVEFIVRRNMVAEDWPDEVLIGVIEKGPMAEVLPKICAEVLEKRRNEARWRVEQQDRQATKEALADIKRAAETGPTPHWSTVPIFWILLATLGVAAIAAWPVVRSWFR